MITVISIVVPTTMLHQTLHCGYLAGILFYALNRFFLFHCYSFCHKKKKQVQRDETIVSKGSSQDSIHDMTAEPPMVSASHSPWQLSFCSILGVGPGSNTQDPQEESREGSVKSPKHDTVSAPSLCRTYSFPPVDPHSAPYLILVVSYGGFGGKLMSSSL